MKAPKNVTPVPSLETLEPTFREVYHLFNKVDIDWCYQGNSPTDLWTGKVHGAGVKRPPQNIFVQL